MFEIRALYGWRWGGLWIRYGFAEELGTSFDVRCVRDRESGIETCCTMLLRLARLGGQIGVLRCCLLVTVRVRPPNVDMSRKDQSTGHMEGFRSLTGNINQLIYFGDIKSLSHNSVKTIFMYVRRR